MSPERADPEVFERGTGFPSTLQSHPQHWLPSAASGEHCGGTGSLTPRCDPREMLGLG